MINWDTFSISKGERVEFVQPHSHSSVINRVDREVSHIDGMLKANGRIYLLNPNGVLVGKQGIISAASFLATTLDFDEARALQGGELLFKGNSSGAIINCGKVEALSGDVLLLAKAVINEGTLEAKSGVVGIAASREVLLKPEGSQRLYISLKEGEDATIENGGLVQAARAELQADGNVFRLAINQTGVIEATGIAEESGQIVLRADRSAIENSGTLCAEAGSIHVLGEEVKIADGALIDVSGVTGGGEILIGGGCQGLNPAIPNAKRVTFEKGGYANASATQMGDGGRVILWSDEATAFDGAIEARGGELGGDGGFVEVSSKGALYYKGTSDLRAVNGEFGTLLLDPSDVTISTSASSGVTLTDGVFVPGASVVIINTNDLIAALGMGNVQVVTQSPYSQNGDVEILNPFTWGQPTTLFVIADRDITMDYDGVISATGGGSIVLDSGRNFNMQNGGSISATGGGAISINGRTGIANLLSTDSREASIVTDSGNISININGDLILAAEGSQLAQIATQSGSININNPSEFESSGDVLIGGPGGSSTSITSVSGSITIESGGDLIVLGSTTASTPTFIYNDAGINQFTIGRNLLVEGGEASNATAAIGSLNGDLSFEVGNDVNVKSGKGLDANATVGHFRMGTEVQGAGELLFSSVGGNLKVEGDGGYALIGATSSPGPGDWEFQGDILIQGVRGSVDVIGGDGASMIGFGIAANNGTYQGNLIIEAEKNVRVKSQQAGAIIGSTQFDGNFKVTIPKLSVSGQNVVLNGGIPGEAVIGAIYPSNSVNADANIKQLSVKALKEVTVTPGGQLGGIGGRALIGVSAAAGTAKADISIQADLVQLNGSSELLQGFSQILSSSGEGAAPRNIQIQTKTLDVGGAGTIPGSAEINASKSLLVLAEDNIFLRPASRVEATNALTLVADFKGLKSLEVGDGGFEIYPGAQLNTPGPLRICTASRKFNLIEAPLNGATFVPGPVFVDTPQERWAAAYPKDLGGFPFTIFYKTGLDPLWPTKSTRIFAEMFANLSTYDQLLFDWKCFLLGYDKACYDQLFHPKGMVSSFDLFSEENEYMLRQKYRNNRLKYVESF